MTGNVFRKPFRRVRRKISAQSGPINITLNAGAGSLAFHGNAAAFVIAENDGAGSFAVTGIPAASSIAEAASAGSFALAGGATAFRFAEAPLAGHHGIVGIASAVLITEFVTPAASVSLACLPAGFTIAINS